MTGMPGTCQEYGGTNSAVSSILTASVGAVALHITPNLDANANCSVERNEKPGASQLHVWRIYARFSQYAQCQSVDRNSVYWKSQNTS